jgi:peptide/nickel transport system substrate-binding protein
MRLLVPTQSRRAFFGLAGTAAAAMSLVAPVRSFPASASQDIPTPVPQRGGTLMMLVDPEPTTLVALTNSADPTMLVSAKVTEGLLSYSFDLDPRPQLATRWSVSGDGRQLTFELRKGVRWHDGGEFTSDDVAFSIGLLKAYHPRGRTTFANVAEVRTPDRHTAVLVLSKPAPFLLHAFAACESPMVPRHAYTGTDIATAGNGAAPIGTGPFIFKEWIKGSHILYERNPAYWDNPKPYLDRLVIKFIKDPAERVSAIESGAIQLAPGAPVPPEELHRLQSNPGLVFETQGYTYTNQVVRLEFNLDAAVFGNLKVRRAIAHAIDRSTIIKEAWFGYGQPAFGPISPDLKQFCAPDLGTPAFNPIEAERLLDDAGLPRGPDGIRLRLALDYVPAGDGYRRTADCISAALRTLGIEAEVRSQDFPAYIKRVYTDRDFQFTVSRMNNMFDPSVGVQRVFWSKNFQPGVPFSNGSHYASPAADDALERAAVETDPGLRRGYFLQFQKTVVADLPDVTLLVPGQITIAGKAVVGHTLTADGAAANLAEIRFGG